MTGSMRRMLAAAVAMWALAGCGAGTTPNARMAARIVSAPPATATVGVPYEYTVVAAGMTPVRFEVVSGPDNFEVHPTSGIVTWTPTEEGMESIEIRATNLAGSDTQSFRVDVEGLSGPVFTTEPPVEATVAAPYAYDPMVVARGEVSWSAPVAPQGLSIDPQTGAVRWTPSADQAGDQAVTIRATEVASGRFTDQSFTVAVVDTGGPAVITSTPPDRVYAGERWTYPATAAGAPTIEWSLVTPSSGNAAVGVSIVTDPPEGSSVAVEWDTSGTSPGDYTIALRVDNGLGEADTQEFTVTVDPRPPVPVIDLATVPPPPTIFVGSAYEYDVNLVPGTGSIGVVFSVVGTVPEDLAITIDPATGRVSFTASDQNGEIEYRYTVRAQNVLGEGDEATIVVNAVYPPATPILTVMPMTDFILEVGQKFPGASATATGNPAPTLSIDGTLPDFLAFDPLTGLLSASASKPAPVNADIGEHSFDIVATNSEGFDRETIRVTVIASAPRVDSITPAAGRRESDVSVVVRGGGFVSVVSPVVRLELGDYSEALVTTFIDENTLSAIVPVDGSRPSGVYDVVVDQGSTTTLAKRFTVTEGDGSTLSGTISTDLTLSAIASPHVVTGDVHIENGATVTLEPGAVLMFAGNSNLRVDVGVASAGALVADGGQPGVGDQIVLTRFQEAGGPLPSGHYRGVRFGANGISSVTKLRNVVVEFAGRRNSAIEQGGVEVLAGAAPRIHDSVIRESLNYGLYAQSGAGTEVTEWFDRNVVTANARGPISIGADEVSTLGAVLDLTGNGRDRVFVRGSVVSRPDSSWASYGVPYYLSAGLVVRGGSRLELKPGTEMRFAPTRRLQVSTGGAAGEEGTLIAEGSAGAPIRMVADTGTWSGILLDDNVQPDTVLRHVRIEALSANPNGSVRLDPGRTVAAVQSCLLQSAELGSVGVSLGGGARIRSFQNNVLDVEELSVDAPMPGFSDLLEPSNVYEAPLRVRASSVSGEGMVWSKPTASDASTQPIRPTGALAISDGSLRIAAGNRIEMPLNGQLAMTRSQLVVEGTAMEPVVFEPATGVSYWYRIRLRGPGANGASKITNVVLVSAGSDPASTPSTQRSAIVVEADGGLPATPEITATSIVDSNGYGMTFGDDTHCSGACNANTIVGSRFSALRMFANFLGRFGTDNSLVGNDTSGTLGHEGVWVVGDVVDTTATWPDNGVPYVVHGDIELRQSHPLDEIPTVTIEPGAELRFASGRRLRVGEGNEGVLDARGTSAAPITFTSIDEASSVFWRGIDLNQGSDGSILDHVRVSFGGSAPGSGNLNVNIGSVATVGIATFTYGASYGAVVHEGSAPTFAGPTTDRTYELNGQASNPGVGDPAFDCVRDIRTGTCLPL